MSGKNQIASFKEKFGASSAFVGGTLSPSMIGIVGLDPSHPLYIKGVDVALEDWNEDLWDDARLTLAISDPIDPEKLIQTVDMGGSIPPVSVTCLRDMVLSVEGRRRILGTRAANKILMKRGAKPDELIELSLFVDKSTDLEVSVRVGNGGRLDDPPFVKAANAARLKCRGKSNDQIAAILEAEINSITNWLSYAENLDPKIKIQIEAGPKADRIPFAVGVELAKNSGKGEHVAQQKALAYLLQSNAKLTAEKGRENAKTVMCAVMSGVELPTFTAATSEIPAPPPSAPDSGPVSEQTSESPIRQRGGATGQRGPSVATKDPKLSWSAIREINAHLEPSPNDPLVTAADRIACAIFQVITGQDPTAVGLEEWPRIQEKFRKVVRSGDALVAPKVKPAEFAVPQETLDSVRSLVCPNVVCNKGVDASKRQTCNTCGGYGKISPAQAAKRGKK